MPNCLADKVARHKARVWLVNTGWSGGSYGVGKRIKLAYTRAIVDAIHGGRLADAPRRRDPIVSVRDDSGLSGRSQRDTGPARRVAAAAPITMRPRASWPSCFATTFSNYESAASTAIQAAGPR